jgi:hypothetical protein
MVSIKRVLLDVLKPHQPDALEFALALAAVGFDYRVRLVVIEVDEKTESVQVEIQANDINFSAIKSTLSNIGASLHSIDEVETQSSEDHSDGV